ncbi:MAG: GNAT family N-acetyltransferase [Ferruginibacter sp.]
MFFLQLKFPTKTLQSFIELAFDKFKFAEITFNFLNDIAALKNFSNKARNNYVLPLTNAYSDIAALYHSSITKDLKRSKKFDVVYKATPDYASVLKLYETLYKKRLEKWADKDVANFSIICKKMLQENNLVVRNVHDKNGAILAAVILLKDDKRLYNIISCITTEGRRMGVNHLLYNELIKEFSNSNYCLDFEGSDIKGVAEFYSRFPTINEQYAFVKWNNLPWLAKIFKK